MSLIVLISLAAVFLKTFNLAWEEFWAAVSAARVIVSYKLTFATSLVAAVVNAMFGGIVAWVLVRYRFPGKRIITKLEQYDYAGATAIAVVLLVVSFALLLTINRLQAWTR